MNRNVELRGPARCLSGMRKLLLLALTCGAASVAQGEVYRCTDAAGHKHYQDQPCAKDADGALLDLTVGNVTTIDSEAARREAQGALATREQTRAQNAPPPKPEAPAPEAPEVTYELNYDAGYPVYLMRPDSHRDRHDHHHHDPDLRPDSAPTADRPRRAGGNYVPAPPTIREVAPRPPSTSRSTARDEDERR